MPGGAHKPLAAGVVCPLGSAEGGATVGASSCSERTARAVFSSNSSGDGSARGNAPLRGDGSARGARSAR